MPKFKTKINLEGANVFIEETVEAYKWTGNNHHFILKFLGPNYLTQQVDGDYHRLHIHDHSRKEVMTADVGNWIVKKNNKISVCLASTFEKTYEEIIEEVPEFFEEPLQKEGEPWNGD